MGRDRHYDVDDAGIHEITEPEYLCKPSQRLDKIVPLNDVDPRHLSDVKKKLIHWHYTKKGYA